jgi:hypothetical protein
VSYIKAMDVWMLGSILFMFGALCELAIISYVSRRRDQVSPKVRSSAPKWNGKKVTRARSIENGFERPLLSEDDTSMQSTPRAVGRKKQSAKVQSRKWPTWPGETDEAELNTSARDKSTVTPEMVDKVFLWLYPPLFFFFNLGYWTYYLPHSLW